MTFNLLKKAMIPVAVAVTYGSILAPACGRDSDITRVSGEAAAFLGGQVVSWADRDEEGGLVQAGFDLPYHLVQRASAIRSRETAVLEFPKLARKKTFLDHLVIEWVPAGEESGNYEWPHFEILVFGLDREQRADIHCRERTSVPENLLPQGYRFPDPEDPRGCRPGRGVPAGPLSDLNRNPDWVHSLLLGYHRDRLAYIEPRIARRHLLQKRSVAFELPDLQWTGWPGKTRLPTRLDVTWLDRLESYSVSLGDFVEVP